MVAPKVTPPSPSSRGHTITVDSPAVNNDGHELVADYSYRRNHITHAPNGGLSVKPKTHEYKFKTQLKPAKTGLLLVGLGGNNGSTVTGAIVANRERMTWRTRNGEQSANYWGSITQATTVHLGWDGSEQIHVPFKDLLPTVDPNSLVVDGWDINNANLYEALKRSKVFEPALQDMLRPHLEPIVPMPSIYYPDFIASNQESRVNHVIPSATKQEHLDHIRRDIRQFKQKHNLDCVIVLWTANTERFAEERSGLNSTAAELLESIAKNDSEVAPSHIFAVASIMEGAHYINGSPQNSLVAGVVDLARQHRVFLGGDDFKSGQTKLKSALVDYLVSSGIKPESIVSYNHLGNNDGKNLSEARQFRSKEITKSSVVDDMVQSNQLLYPDGKN
uniref:inositol-3-phosphate synthase n=1 Tax=Plectus sambesii TaxID=2011161 RepID=A0A914WZN9_9BILA